MYQVPAIICLVWRGVLRRARYLLSAWSGGGVLRRAAGADGCARWLCALVTVRPSLGWREFHSRACYVGRRVHNGGQENGFRPLPSRVEMPVIEYRIVGLPHLVDTDELEAHVERILRGASVVESQYFLSKNKRTIALLTVEAKVPIDIGAKLLRKSRFEGTILKVELSNKNGVGGGEAAEEPAPLTTMRKNKPKTSNKWNQLAKDLVVPFYEYVKEEPDRLERASDREEVGLLFREYCQSNDAIDNISPSRNRRLESLVLMMMRKQKLMRSKRYGDKVVVAFAKEEPGDFADESEARERVLHKMEKQSENKNGVVVSEAMGLPDIVPLKGWVSLYFQVESRDSSVQLEEVAVAGPEKRSFAVDNSMLPTTLSRQISVLVVFTSTGIGLYRGSIQMRFTDGVNSFLIVRYVTIRSGDEAMNDILKPTAPYEKKKRRREKRPDEVIPPPIEEKNRKSSNPFAQLPRHKIPKEFQQLLTTPELEYEPEKPDMDVSLYPKFWNELLWASECQAYKDIKLYDMDSVKLVREGRFMVLHVPGLAEGRPSVLRGDLVNVTWKGSLYKGRVHQTRLLDVLMELDGSFHTRFNQSLDAVDVRFTFSRTTFRTSHEGCTKAVDSMGEHMLAPKLEHEIVHFDRSVPRALLWANRSLNDEQRATVFHIVKGGRRPLPYIVFGPPGTGKFPCCFVDEATMLCCSRLKFVVLLFS